MLAISKGFTLIELVIVIILLSALGIMTSSYIATGVDIYSDVTERDRSLNSIRFVMERLRREVSDALPNSLAVNVSANSNCLTFRPIKASTVYAPNFPIYPLSSSVATISNTLGYSFVAGDQAVVYLLNQSELPVSTAIDSDKAKTISAISSNSISFTTNVSFPLSSPGKRLYIIRDKVSYCFRGTDITRSLNDATPILMAENIKNGSFNVQEATLQRNGLVQMKLTLNFDGQEAEIDQTLSIGNTP